MAKNFASVYDKVAKLNLLPSKQALEEEYRDFDFSNPNNIQKIKEAFARYTGNSHGVISRQQFKEIAEVLGFTFNEQFYYQIALLADFKGNDEYAIGNLLGEITDENATRKTVTKLNS
jgi:Ca2+-binding EF-hand superfamily protein